MGKPFFFFRFSVFLLLFSGVFLSTCSFADYVPGEVVVKFKKEAVNMQGTVQAIGAISTKSPSLKNALIDLGAQKIEKVFPDSSYQIPQGTIASVAPKKHDLSLFYLLVFNRNANIIELAKQLSALPNVEMAEPNYICKAFLTPNDPQYSSQWGLGKIQSTKAWDVTTGEASIIIAVVDTGVDYYHEDLAGKVVLGRNYVDNNNNPLDDEGHGTHVAGIASAISNNSIGISGTDWNAKILAIKVLDSGGEGTDVNVARGIDYAASHSANIINLSLGEYTRATLLEEAVASAYSAGCIVVAAAGNDNTSEKSYPAAFDNYVIAVAATDQNDVKSDWGIIQGAHYASNYGIWVDVCAPGTSILSTYPDNGYTRLNGTSMSTPFVSGLAALILSQNPSQSQATVRSRIETSCDSIEAVNPGYIGLLGHGRINCGNALGWYPSAIIHSPESGSYLSGTIEVIGTAQSSTILNYNLSIGSGYPAVLFEPLASGSSEVISGPLYSLNTKRKSDGIYTLKLICYNLSQFSSEAQNKVTIDNTNPSVSITYPTSMQQIDGTITIKGSVSDANLKSYTLGYDNGGSQVVLASSTEANLNNILCDWNTTGLKGNYTLVLTAIDKALNTSTVFVTVEALNGQNPATPSISGVPSSTPNPFNLSKSSITYIHYNLTTNLNTSIYIFNLNGELVYKKNYLSGQEGGKSGNNFVPWNGKDSVGNALDNGVYLYKIIADSSGGSKSIIGSGRLIIIN